MDADLRLSTPEASETPGVCLSIAGLGVWLETPVSGILDAVLHRYQKYLIPKPLKLTLTVEHHSENPAVRSPEPAATFSEGVISFNEPAFQGKIDPAGGQAWVTLKAPDPMPELEYFLRVIYALLVFEAGGLLFHAAGIIHERCAYLFFGPSGTGKTTVARSVEENRVMNDDLVVLLPAEGHWTVNATPFWNPSQVVPAGPRQAPLRGLFRLVQSQETYLESMGSGQALAELVANTPVVAADPSRGLALLARAQQLMNGVPPQRLHLRLGDNIWPVVMGSG